MESFLVFLHEYKLVVGHAQNTQFYKALSSASEQGIFAIASPFVPQWASRGLRVRKNVRPFENFGFIGTGSYDDYIKRGV